MIAYAQMGDANASIPTPQPVLPRPMFGAYGAAPSRHLGPLRVPAGARGRPRRPPAGRPEAGRRGRRALARQGVDALNDALPDIEVNPDTFAVKVNGELIEPAPAEVLPMAQRYFLF